MHGVFNSVAGVGGAVTDTVSKLTFDDEYQMKRKSSKRKAMADQGGVGKGLMQVTTAIVLEFLGITKRWGCAARHVPDFVCIHAIKSADEAHTQSSLLSPRLSTLFVRAPFSLRSQLSR